VKPTFQTAFTPSATVELNVTEAPGVFDMPAVDEGNISTTVTNKCDAAVYFVPADHGDPRAHGLLIHAGHSTLLTDLIATIASSATKCSIAGGRGVVTVQRGSKSTQQIF